MENKKARLLQRAVDDPDRSRQLKYSMGESVVKSFFTDEAGAAHILRASERSGHPSSSSGTNEVSELEKQERAAERTGLVLYGAMMLEDSGQADDQQNSYNQRNKNDRVIHYSTFDKNHRPKMINAAGNLEGWGVVRERINANGRVWPCYGHRAQIGCRQPQPQVLQRSFPCLFTSCFRMEPETDEHQYEESRYASGARESREVLEEITGQPHGKNSFSQVTDKFTDIFLSFIFNLGHQEEIYQSVPALSRFISADDSAEMMPLAACVLSPAKTIVPPAGFVGAGLKPAPTDKHAAGFVGTAYYAVPTGERAALATPESGVVILRQMDSFLLN